MVPGSRSPDWSAPYRVADFDAAELPAYSPSANAVSASAKPSGLSVMTEWPA